TTALLDFRERRTLDGTVSWVVATGRGTDGVEKPFTGSYVASAQLNLEPGTNRPGILVELDAEGTALLADVTRRLVGQQLGVFLDGEPLMTPTVQQPIAVGRVRITANFTSDEAR